MRKALPLLLILALLPACGNDNGDAAKEKVAKERAAAAKRDRERTRRLERKLREAQKQDNTSTGTTTTPPANANGGSTAPQSNGCPAGLIRQGTEACAKPDGSNAGCGGDQYATPKVGGGCMGPAHPPSKGPAKPSDCPAGQVPVGETGACAPK